ncbi:MAG: sulfatase-like hydrolase/transferase, partial [Candidatus Binataceae bacterium]
IRTALADAQAALNGAGYHAASAFAVSPTYGGESWLAHSTLLSGLPVTTQARYQALVHSDRPTLSGDFKHAGWRTIALMPEITGDWPEARYFGFDDAFTAPEIGYRGPPFGYITMPDQFVLKALADRALGPGHAPVMATVALVSSHIPWAPIPKFVPWDQVGDGSVFASARTTEDPDVVWREDGGITRAYGQSVEYVLRTITSFITTYGNDHTLVLILGDHQPMSFIAGDIGHDVPVHVIARDPALLRAFTAGHWAAGMLPDATSPVVPMEALRGQITAAYTPGTQR